MIRQKLTEPFIRSISDKAGTKVADTIDRNLQVWVGKTSVTFYVVIKHDGKQRFIKLGRFPQMHPDGARNLTRKKIAEVLTYNYSSPHETGRMITVGQVIDEYIEYTEPKNRPYIKSAMYRWTMQRNMKLSHLTPEIIQEVHDNGKDTPACANRAVKYLRAAITLAKRQHRLNIYNPALGTKMFREFPRTRYMTKEEGRRFVEKAFELEKSNLYRVQVNALLMMLYTGARKSNVLSMRYDEIDKDGLWVIPREKFKTGKTDHKILLGKRELEIVEKMKETSKNGYVFEKNGRCMKDVKRTMFTICKMAGIENLHIHDLRRTLGTWMLSSGTDIAVVSKKLGHSSIKITEQVYAHMLPDVASDATEKALDEMLGDSEDGNKSE